MTLPRRAALSHHSTSQRGIALAVSLILLVVATLIGLAGIRGTTLQERMSANLYDRSLAFQTAESALREAEAAIAAEPDITALGGIDCTAANVQCPPIPANAFSNDNTGWRNAATLANTELSAATAQYHLQLLGNQGGTLPAGMESANDANYGGETPTDPGTRFYRVTVRNGNPGTLSDRALVVLQSVVCRGSDCP